MKLNLRLRSEYYHKVRDLSPWLKKPISVFHQIKGLRKALEMTQAQLAKRSRITERSIRALEAEQTDPSLSTLKKVAKGLECELLLRFVPKKPIEKQLKERAIRQAEKIVQLAEGMAAMEDQAPKKKYSKQQIQELAEELIEKKPSLLWEED